jgi:drug/metabolite transporter (DMT)-like permease
MADENGPSAASPPPPPPPPPRRAASALLTAWAALVVAILAMSSGGIWFALLDTTPAGLRACWRLFVTSLMLFPGAFVQWRRADPALRRRTLAALPLMLATGAALAVHFVTWSWSVGHTSLTHALLFVSTTPLLLVGWFGARHVVSRIIFVPNTSGAAPAAAAATSAADPGEGEGVSLAGAASPIGGDGAAAAAAAGAQQQQPPSSSFAARARAYFSPSSSLAPTRLEIAGTILGFIGACVLILSAEGEAGLADDSSISGGGENSSSIESRVTVAGDLVAVVGALAMAIYLGVGGSLRKWLPLFLYTFPVTAMSALVSGLISLALEDGVTFGGLGEAALFGFLGDGKRLGIVLAAAFCSGILGHTLANFSLQHINPLVVSVAGLWEPLLGSVLGWLAGVQSVPGVATLVAGPVLILGAVATTLGARDSGFKAKCGENACARWWWPEEDGMGVGRAEPAAASATPSASPHTTLTPVVLVGEGQQGKAKADAAHATRAPEGREAEDW